MTTRCTWGGGMVIAMVMAGALVAGGCGGTATTDSAQQTPAPAAQAQAQPQPLSQLSSPPATDAAPAAQPAPAAEAAPAAAPNALVQEHETGVEVTLVEAKRTGGDSLTVKWRYRNTTPKDVKISKGGTSWLDTYQLTADAFLIDAANKKKYLVITDAENYPLASKHGDWQGVTLAPGQTLSAWAKFPAPPADVEKISVTLAGVSPFEDVPIAK